MPLPVLVRNFEAGPTVFTDHITKDFVEWQGADDENGGDVQVVPEAFFNNANFIRALQRGTFGIENSDENPELSERLEKHLQVESLKRQRVQADSRRTLSEDEAASKIERTENNDSLVVPCVGPTRGSQPCNEDVVVKASKLNSAPPLCSKHKALENEYVPQEDWVDRKRVVTWNRVRLAKREKQES